ncbi:hypothetical protein C8J55DRAFT_560790 [Lentinula edodes]|uniref:Uncharacterized protein n=1 Tax=Lentinula lateritia TaxID=40482 RepID=A0A9W9ACG6_9AGAR|nr:hypothetical protein C8J55DRAFT_560790 [Lentinula edodes]
MSLSPILPRTPLYSLPTSNNTFPGSIEGSLLNFSHFDSQGEEKYVLRSPLQTRHPPVSQAPQDDLQMQYYHLKVEHGKLEQRFSNAIVELKITQYVSIISRGASYTTLRNNYEQLLQTIKEAPAHTPNPTTALLRIPMFSHCDYPCVTIWTKDDFTKAENLRSSRGVPLKIDNSSTGLWWLQDANGNSLDTHTISHVREMSKCVWQRLKVQGRAPPRFLDADIDVINEFNHYMINMFNFLGFCDNNWKTRQIFVIDYPSWYSKHVKNSRGPRETPENLHSTKWMHSNNDPDTKVKRRREEYIPSSSSLSSDLATSTLSLLAISSPLPASSTTPDSISIALDLNPSILSSSLTAPEVDLSMDPPSLMTTQASQDLPVATTPVVNPASLNIPSVLTGVFDSSKLAASIVPLPSDPTAVAPPKKEKSKGVRSICLGSKIDAHNIAKKEWAAAVQAEGKKPVQDDWVKFWHALSEGKKLEYKEKARVSIHCRLVDRYCHEAAEAE